MISPCKLDLYELENPYAIQYSNDTSITVHGVKTNRDETNTAEAQTGLFDFDWEYGLLIDCR